MAPHDGRVAVGGQRNGLALVGGVGSNGAGADQLATLLGPDTAAAGEDPRGPEGAVTLAALVVVYRPANDGRAAVGGQRKGLALVGAVESNRAGADNLWPLLRELRQRQLR
jgi:hypothetical protein